MILYIDDEPRYIESFIDDLKIEFGKDKIELQRKTDKAISYFNQNLSNINLVILDIMMPSGNTFKNEPTKEGLLTGLFIYKAIREVDYDLPIIIFTNTPEDYIHEIADNSISKIKEIIEDLKIDLKSKKTLFLQKENLFPYELTEKVHKFID